jgi:HEAT repeat protein/cyclophilin family peptidyl-prolyl cis-trans isomerase
LKLVLAVASLALVVGPFPRVDKLTRITALEQERTAGSEMERYLSDSDAGVRRRAALAVGRIGGPESLSAVANLLSDRQSEVRQMAAFALGLAHDRSAIAALRAALRDPDPAVRARVAEALGRIGDPAAAEDVARMVLSALPRGARVITVRGDDPGSASDPWIELRLGLFALAALGDARVAESVLMLDGQARFDWWAAAYAATRLRSPQLTPVHLAATRSSDPLCRALGARGLGAVGGTDALPALAGLMNDPEEAVVAHALRALGQIGDARAAPAAISALASNNMNIKQEALAALARLPLDRTQREQVVPYVGYPDPAVRAAAVGVLARRDPEQLALVLSGSDPDPVWFVRAALVRAAGEAEGDFALGLAFAGLRDGDARVLPAALQALQRLKGADAVDTLRKHLQHSDAFVRASAAEALSVLRAPALGDALRDAYQGALSDPECEARAALVGTLATDASASATAALRLAAERDTCLAVRERAMAALGNRDKVVASLPRPAPRPLVDDRVAVAPFAPLTGLPLFTPRVFIHTPRGVIEIHLNVVDAPVSCASFIWLARRGFYNDLVIDDVLPGVAVWGGSPRGERAGGPGFALRNEVGERPFGRGAVGLTQPPGARDMAGSRFVITLSPAPDLDGATTLLGWVVSGMDVASRLRPGDAIERVDVWEGR